MPATALIGPITSLIAGLFGSKKSKTQRQATSNLVDPMFATRQFDRYTPDITKLTGRLFNETPVDAADYRDYASRIQNLITPLNLQTPQRGEEAKGILRQAGTELDQIPTSFNMDTGLGKVAGDISGVARGMRTGRAETFSPASRFFRTALGGSQEELQQLLGPQLNTILSQYDNAAKAASETGPRGGGRVATASESPFAKIAAYGQALAGARSGAAGKLADIGSAEAAAAAQEAGVRGQQADVLGQEAQIQTALKKLGLEAGLGKAGARTTLGTALGGIESEDLERILKTAGLNLTDRAQMAKLIGDVLQLQQQERTGVRGTQADLLRTLLSEQGAAARTAVTGSQEGARIDLEGSRQKAGQLKDLGSSIGDILINIIRDRKKKK